MRIGSFLFTQCQNPAEDGRYIRETLQEARLAEQLGADAVFLAEHHFDGNCVYVDPPTFAAALSMATTRIKIGFAVIQTSLYHPLRLAEQISLIDHLSEGRLIVGLGKGSMVNTYEYAAYGVDPADAQERFEEVEAVMLRCWTEDAVSHRGKYWSFDVPQLRPRPFTRPHPPVLRAVTSEGSIKGQAKQGRPIILGPGPLDVTKKAVALYRDTMSEAGFSDDAVAAALQQSWVSRQIILADTDDEAERVGLPFFREMQTYRAAQSPAYRDRVLSSPAERPRGVFMGSPATVGEQAEALAAIGIGGILARFRCGPAPVEFSTRALTLFMSEIAPRIRPAPASAQAAE